MAMETATLAGGCFWCLEAVFDQLSGVASVESGYMGGQRPNPTYEDICTGETGHAEVVRVTFDADVVDFRDLLAVFFTIHDPTTLNFQGSDVGTQYRSAIFFHSPEQEQAARETIAKLDADKLWSDPIVTEVTAASDFWPAEDYHQEYFERVGSQNPYCSYVVKPKVAKFRKRFMDRLKKP
ncbi:MAG: peptide-methionine (S)-S-oxide reductase MsrA [Betaproteobacteria bacterium]|nr:peptide-methionine (S)-S-oxide reductase MsrA [Betaproteobacteria bacterium]